MHNDNSSFTNYRSAGSRPKLPENRVLQWFLQLVERWHGSCDEECIAAKTQHVTNRNKSMKDTLRIVAATAPTYASVSTINRVNVSGASTATVSTAPHLGAIPLPVSS